VSRRRIPTKIKKLRDTFRPARAVNEPEPELVTPLPPNHLDPVAREEWDRISAELESLGLLSNLDRTALAGYCLAYSRWIKAEEILAKSSLLIMTGQTKDDKGHLSGGCPIQNPMLAVSNKAQELMIRYLSEFGMTPASRSKIDVKPQAKKKNRFELLDETG
jgi:P27 family predicted phage terminase small subunit